MASKGNIYQISNIQNLRRHQERKEIISKNLSAIPQSYNYDINKYIDYCQNTEQSEYNIESTLDFLYISLSIERVKKTTWERRLASLKKYFQVQCNILISDNSDWSKEVSVLRELYKEEQYSELIHLNGKSPVNKIELLDMIRVLPTREKAICLVQLITANRPSEMVRLKIANFNLESRYVNIYMKKQREWQQKRLTQEVVKSVKDYIDEYELQFDDYFIGRLNRSGKYISVQASDSGYRYMLSKWTGLTSYNFRKTQVTAMHSAGADLPTIAKQTGHKSLDTITKHYLSVSDDRIDKYL